MDRIEFYGWLEKQVLQRWPKWQVNKVILWDWFYALGRYDERLLNAAVHKHKIADDTNEPKIRRIIELVKGLLPARMRESPAVPPEQRCSSFKQFLQKTRTQYTKEKRIKNVAIIARYNRQEAAAGDPEAYKWAVDEGLTGDRSQQEG